MKVIQGSSTTKINQGTSAVLSYHRSFEDLRSVFEIESPPKIFGRPSGTNIILGSSEDLGDGTSHKHLRDQRSFKDLRKIFAGRDQTIIVGKIIQETSQDLEIKDRSKIFEIKDHFQRPSKNLRDKDHSRISEIKYQSRNFSRTFISQIIRAFIECLRDQKSSMDIRKLFENKYHSRIFGRCWRSNIIQISSRSKIIQGPLENIHW